MGGIFLRVHRQRNDEQLKLFPCSLPFPWPVGSWPNLLYSKVDIPNTFGQQRKEPIERTELRLSTVQS